MKSLLLEGVAQDVRFAGRSFRRSPLVALTIVTTVGLGLGLTAVVFTLLNLMVFRVDDVRNPHELFAVERPRSAARESEGFTRAQYDALVRETGVFFETFASTPEIDVWIDGQRMEGPLVTGNFFRLLGVNAARGRSLTLSDDQHGSAPAIVLSHRAWSRYFANDPGVFSRTALLNGARVNIVGVMPEGFRGLTMIAPDFWAPLSLLGQFQPGDQGRENGVGLQIVGRLKPGLSRDQALAQLLVWDARQATSSVERSRAALVLEPRQGTVPLSADVMLLFLPLFFAFGLILMIGWANVANLLLARAVARQREIGIRLALGASRRRLVRQLLTESLLLALVSSVLAFGISRLVLEAAFYAITSTWSSSFGDLRISMPPADWRVALFLIAGAIVSTLFFALAPALRATRLELVRAMRGDVVRNARPGLARSALVTLQVTASALLLICAAVFLRSTWAISAVDPGFRTADTVNVNVLNEQRRAAILEVLRSAPSITSVAASSPAVLGGRPAVAETFASAGAPLTAAPRPGVAGGVSGRSAVTYQFVSPEYFDVLGIELTRGRGFAQNEVSVSAGTAIVAESVARRLWPATDALGQIVRLEPDASDVAAARSLVVAGIARDVAGFHLGGERMAGAGIYLPTNADTAGTSLTVRARGDSELTRRALVDRLAAIDPNMAEVITLRTIARIGTYVLAIPFWLTLVLGALALVLTLSGLFSVVSYLVEQRTREIGVRMALGATSRNIAALVLRQSARPVGIGLLLGASLTAALGAVLLATPAAELIGSAIRLFDPVAYAASLLCIVAACACAALVPALRAGRIAPMIALRQD